MNNMPNVSISPHAYLKEWHNVKFKEPTYMNRDKKKEKIALPLLGTHQVPANDPSPLTRERERENNPLEFCAHSIKF